MITKRDMQTQYQRDSKNILKLEKLYQNILNNSQLTNFHNVINLYFKCKGFGVIADETIIDKDIDDDLKNFIWINGKKKYLDDFALSKIEFTILNKMFESTDKEVISDYNENEKVTLQAMLDIAINDLLNSEEKSPKNKKMQQIFTYVNTLDTQNNFHYFIRKCLSHCFLREKRKINIKAFVPRISVALELCESIIIFLLYKSTNLNDILCLIESDNPKELALNATAVSFIKTLLKTDYNKDFNTINDLFKFYGINDIIVSKFMYLYIMDLFYTQFKKYPESYSSIFDEVSFCELKAYYFRKKVMIQKVQLGNYFVEFLIKNNICSGETLYSFKHKQKLCIKMNVNLIKGLLDIYKLKKPHLIPLKRANNIYLKLLETNSTLEKDSTVLMGQLNKRHIKKFIHNNLNIELYLNNRFHCETFKQKFNYTISKEIFVIFIEKLINVTKIIYEKLNVIENSSNTLVNILLANDDFKYIISFYDINEKILLNLLNKYAKNTTSIIFANNLLFLLVYAVVTTPELDKAFNDLKKILKSSSYFYGKNILIKLKNKIEQYKIYFVGLIKDAILYSQFNYFITDSFIDARGRLYNKEVFLNIQNYPQAKAFVKPYVDLDNTFNMDTWKAMYSFFNENNKNTKDIIYSYPNYACNKVSLKNKAIVLDYIYSFFDKNDVDEMTFKNFMHTIKPLQIEEILNFIIKNIKKPKQTWILFSRIIRYLYNDESSVVEYDASNSGLQMISILFKHADLAKECNLMGNTYVDVYTKILHQLKNILKDLQYLLENTLKIYINNYTYEKVFSYKKLYSKNIEAITQNEFLDKKQKYIELVYAFFSMDLTSSTWIPQLLKDLYDDFHLLECVIPLTITRFFHLIPKEDLKIITMLTLNLNEKNREIIMFFTILRVAFRMNHYYKNYEWLTLDSVFWNERDLFKKPIMTLYYNATRFTRIDHFKDLLKVKSIESNTQMEDDGYIFYYMANLFELYFINYSLEHMKGITLMQQLTKRLVDKMLPITKDNKDPSIVINNKYFYIKLKALKQKSLQVESSTIKGKRQQISINIPLPEVNKQKMKLMLSPNIIHSMDAFIVHSFCDKVNYFNMYLKGKGCSFRVSYYINHDSFACTFPLITRALLKLCYLELMQEDYINCLNNLTSDDVKELEQMSTKDFIKHYLEDTNDFFMK